MNDELVNTYITLVDRMVAADDNLRPRWLTHGVALRRQCHALHSHLQSMALSAEMPAVVTILCGPNNSALFNSALHNNKDTELLLHNIVRGSIADAAQDTWTTRCIRRTMRLDDVTADYDDAVVELQGDKCVFDGRSSREHGSTVITDRREIIHLPSMGRVRVFAMFSDNKLDYLRPLYEQMGLPTYSKWHTNLANTEDFAQTAAPIGEFLNNSAWHGVNSEPNVDVVGTVLPSTKSKFTIFEAKTLRVVEKGEEFTWQYHKENLLKIDKETDQQKLQNVLFSRDFSATLAQKSATVADCLDSAPELMKEKLLTVLSTHYGEITSGSSIPITPAIARQAMIQASIMLGLRGARVNVAAKTSGYESGLKYIQGTEEWPFPQLEIVSPDVELRNVQAATFMDANKQQRGVFAKRRVQPGTCVATLLGIAVNAVTFQLLAASCSMQLMGDDIRGTLKSWLYQQRQNGAIGSDVNVEATVDEFVEKFPTLVDRALKIKNSPQLINPSKFPLEKEENEWQELVDEISQESFGLCTDVMNDDRFNGNMWRDASPVQKFIRQHVDRMFVAEDRLHIILLLPAEVISRTTLQYFTFLLYGKCPSDSDSCAEEFSNATPHGYGLVVNSRGLSTDYTPEIEEFRNMWRDQVGDTTLLVNNLCVRRAVVPDNYNAAQINMVQLSEQMGLRGESHNEDKQIIVKRFAMMAMETISLQKTGMYQLFSTSIDEHRRGESGGAARPERSPKSVTQTLNAVVVAMVVKAMLDFQDPFRWVLAATRVDLYACSFAVMYTATPVLTNEMVLTKLLSWGMSGSLRTLGIISIDASRESMAAENIIQHFSEQHDVRFVASPLGGKFKLEDIVKMLTGRKGLAQPGMLPLVGNTTNDRRKKQLDTQNVRPLQRFPFDRNNENDDRVIATSALKRYCYGVLKSYRNIFFEKHLVDIATNAAKVLEQAFHKAYSNVPLRQWAHQNAQLIAKKERYDARKNDYNIDVTAAAITITSIHNGGSFVWNRQFVPNNRAPTQKEIDKELTPLVDQDLINRTKRQNSKTIREIAKAWIANGTLTSDDKEWLKFTFARHDYDMARVDRSSKIVAAILPIASDGTWRAATSEGLPWADDQSRTNPVDLARGCATVATGPPMGASASRLPLPPIPNVSVKRPHDNPLLSPAGSDVVKKPRTSDLTLNTQPDVTLPGIPGLENLVDAGGLDEIDAHSIEQADSQLFNMVSTAPLDFSILHPPF